MDIKDFVQPAIALLGVIIGSAALIWRARDEMYLFLRIALEVKQVDSRWIAVKTTVDNRGLLSKRISYAILIIGPEEKGLSWTVRTLKDAAQYSGNIASLSDLEKFVVDKKISTGDAAIIPLTFFTEENVDVADETLTYKTSLDVGSFRPNTPYGVRFYVFCKGRLHRSTQDSFVISG